MQQFFWAVSQEGDRFTAHYIITWCSQRKHNVENITSCVYNIYCSHIFHIKESYMSWLWKRFGGKLMLFWKTHRQIRWSDCRYRRPGSYNRRTRSQWISPFLMDVGGKKQQQLLRQHDKHISAYRCSTDKPSCLYGKYRNLVSVKQGVSFAEHYPGRYFF